MLHKYSYSSGAICVYALCKTNFREGVLQLISNDLSPGLCHKLEVSLAISFDRSETGLVLTVVWCVFHHQLSILVIEILCCFKM